MDYNLKYYKNIEVSLIEKMAWFNQHVFIDSI